MDLILITLSYPYIQGGEQTFINQEIPFLINSFDHLYIIPQNSSGEKVRLDEDKIVINEEYSLNKQPISYKSALKVLLYYNATIWIILIKEILYHPSILLGMKKLLYMLTCLKESYDFSRWVEDFIVKKNLDLSKSVFYTYWFQNTTVGLFLLAKNNPDIKFITRAHGIDLFEERNSFNYFPFRKQTFKKVNSVYPCMNNGAYYLKNKYKDVSTKIKTSYLGVDNYGFVNSASEDGVLRIVTCSTISAIKRLHLIALGIKEIGQTHPGIKIEWIHFGTGILKKDILNLVDGINHKNINVIFKGQVPLNQIISHYRDSPVDIFMNVSSYEGQPVSIKEAVSFGIPVIATNVGGNSEIVSLNNGILLNENPSVTEIANAIKWFDSNRNLTKKMRNNSRNLFLEKYDSKIVYPDFIKQLHSINNA